MARLLRFTAASLVVVFASAIPAQATWDQTTVSNFGNSDSQTSSLVISPDGGTFVAWDTQGSDDLYWARRSATGWRKTQVAGGTFVACYSYQHDWVGPSAGFLPDGTPQIASTCDDSGGGRVMYSRLTKSGWNTVTVGHGPTGYPCSTSATDIDLISGPKGKPVIFTTDWCTKGVLGFFRTNGVWKTVPVIEGGCCSAFRMGAMSLAVDPSNGQIAMALNADVFGRSGLYFQEFTWAGDQVPGSFHSFVLPNGDAAYSEPSLAFAPDGTAYIAFQEGSAYGAPLDSAYSFLALLTRTAGTWGAPRTIDDAVTFTGGEPSMSLAGGTFHIAYQDDTTRDLRYATSPDGTTWTFDTILSKGDTGHFPSLAITASGAARISFYNRSDTALRAVSGP